MTLHVTLAINDETIGAVAITREWADVNKGTDRDVVNRYRWWYSSDGKAFATGQVTHRYGDGAVALAHHVFGDIVERQRIAAEAIGGDA